MEQAAVDVNDGWLRVHFGAHGHADFHFRWLRHNCVQDQHPITRERTLCSSELPDALAVTSAVIAEDTLLVRWAHDGRESRYALSWLKEHAYAGNRKEIPPPPSDLERIEIDGTGLTITERVRRARENLLRHGAAVVRRGSDVKRPAEEETEEIIAAFCATGLRVVPTHFGRIEDLRTDNTTNAHTDQLGYTDAAVNPHTDQPFLAEPPRLQLLQSIRAAESGGENYFVDALAAARYLESMDAASYELLIKTPIRFHRQQKAFERVVVSPILSVEAERFRVRYSYFTLAPYDLPFSRMEAWYRAHDRFARLVRDPRHQYHFALRSGDFALYDNHRMLHARKSFRGARWVRGVYFDFV